MEKNNNVRENENSSQSKGITGFVLSLIGILAFIMPYFAILFSIAGIVLGALQLRERKTGLATAALVLGIIGTVLNAMVLFLIAIVLLAGF